MRRPSILSILSIPVMLVLVAAMAGTGAHASPGHAGCRHHGHGSMHGPDPAGFVAHHAERLGLDAETLEAIDGIVAASREETADLRRELREARKELHDLLSAGEPDEARVMEQVEAIGELETRLHQARVRALLQIRALLTPEQRAELERIREEGPFARYRAAAEACAEDIERLCPEASGHGPHGLFCLKKQEAEVSEACRAALESLPHRCRHADGAKPGHPGTCPHGEACPHRGHGACPKGCSGEEGPPCGHAPPGAGPGCSAGGGSPDA